MICPKCGMQLPDDSEFCQYCGTNTLISVEPIQPVVERVALIQKILPTETNTESSSNPQNISGKQKTDSTIKKKTNKKWFIIIVCLVVLLIASAGVIIYQYESLNSTISKKDGQIKKKNSEIATLKNTVSSLEAYADKYDKLISVIKKANLGYAANNFRPSESIIVVGENQNNRKFTLTANWINGGTVSVKYDSIFPSAYVDFDQDNWKTSTKITIEPKHLGVTVVTFSNDVNNQTFDVIIIVE